ncbi:MAG TPA: diacylglycerol kinase family protein [Thermoanaerobaculia bacterium]|nr:diacylglycerol kinase family protein [Thermoanaerobaculia bacterium]
MRRASLIFNPVAGRHGGTAKAPALVAILRAGGFEVAAVPTSGPGDGTRLARESAAAGDEVVFAFGGDGTLREVAAGLLGTPTALGILPGGTTNVLARALGLPVDPFAAARAAAHAKPWPIGVGLCSTAAGEKPFVMMVSAGLDAWLLAQVSPLLKRRLGRAGIGLQGIGAWWRYGYPAIEVEAGGRRSTATFAAACNIELYGGRFRLAPGARADNGRLDLVLFRGTSRGATLGFALALAGGRHLRRQDVEIVPIEGEIRLALPPNAAAQIDGDALGTEPSLTLRLSAERLTVLAPGP